MAIQTNKRTLRGTLPVLLLSLLAGCMAPARPGPTPTPSGLAASLDSIFADSAFQHAHWGVLVRSLATGETLYRRDPAKAFIPASAMKLVTGAVALSALGPDFRYRTTFSATGPLRAGTLQGDLVVRGSGDPTLSERFAPDALATMRTWADSLRAHGITRVAGGIVGVDSAFAGPPLGAGWGWDDLSAGYSAEVGGLQFNEGTIDIHVVPSRTVGEPAIVILEPATQYVHVNNRTVTARAGGATRLDVSRDPSGPVVTLSGVVPADTSAVTLTVAVREPADYFLSVLRETLREAGVAVEGPALTADEWPEERSPAAERQLFAHASPPLREILPEMLKPSQNWIAETLLRTVGRVRRGEGSARAGVAVVDSVLLTWQLPRSDFRMADGSGLSRYDLVTPELFVGILARMRVEPHWQLWYASLPSAGQSGTLENRMAAAPLRGNVHAKTGALAGIRSLAGYLETERGGTVVFAILLNNHLRSAASADRVVEAALTRLYYGSEASVP